MCLRRTKWKQWFLNDLSLRIDLCIFVRSQKLIRVQYYFHQDTRKFGFIVLIGELHVNFTTYSSRECKQRSLTSRMTSVVVSSLNDLSLRIWITILWESAHLWMTNLCWITLFSLIFWLLEQHLLLDISTRDYLRAQSETKGFRITSLWGITRPQLFLRYEVEGIQEAGPQICIWGASPQNHLPWW